MYTSREKVALARPSLPYSGAVSLDYSSYVSLSGLNPPHSCVLAKLVN